MLNIKDPLPPLIPFNILAQWFQPQHGSRTPLLICTLVFIGLSTFTAVKYFDDDMSFSHMIRNMLVWSSIFMFGFFYSWNNGAIFTTILHTLGAFECAMAVTYYFLGIFVIFQSIYIFLCGGELFAVTYIYRGNHRKPYFPFIMMLMGFCAFMACGYGYSYYMVSFAYLDSFPYMYIILATPILFIAIMEFSGLGSSQQNTLVADLFSYFMLMTLEFMAMIIYLSFHDFVDQPGGQFFMITLISFGVFIPCLFVCIGEKLGRCDMMMALIVFDIIVVVISVPIFAFMQNLSLSSTTYKSLIWSFGCSEAVFCFVAVKFFRQKLVYSIITLISTIVVLTVCVVVIHYNYVQPSKFSTQESDLLKITSGLFDFFGKI